MAGAYYNSFNSIFKWPRRVDHTVIIDGFFSFFAPGGTVQFGFCHFSVCFRWNCTIVILSL